MLTELPDQIINHSCALKLSYMLNEKALFQSQCFSEFPQSHQNVSLFLF